MKEGASSEQDHSADSKGSSTPMITFSAFVISLLVSMMLVPVVIRLAFRFGIVDTPNERKVHKQPVPRVGGLAMVMACLVTFAVLYRMDGFMAGYWLAVLIIVVVGVIDDRYDLNFRYKFAAQITAIVLGVLISDVRVELFPFFFTDYPVPSALGYAFAAFFILTVTNAINLSDGLDGLAGGVVVLSLLALVLLAYQINTSHVMFVSMLLAGSIFGFLMFNSHPARLFMGDTGSQFIGFSVGFLALHLVQQSQGVFAVSLPLMIVGLPLMDLLLVMMRRMMKGRPLFAPDKNHLHHRLVNVGLDHYVAVFFVYAMQLSIVAAAYAARSSTDMAVVGLFFAFLMLVHAVPFVLYRLPQGLFPMTWVARFNEYFAQAHLLGCWSTIALVVTIPAFLLIVPMLPLEVERGYATAAGVIAANYALWTFVARSAEAREWILRVSLVALITLELYLLQQFINVIGELRRVVDVFFVGLIGLVLVGMHYAKQRDLSLRPLDILIVAAVMVLPRISRGEESAMLLARLAVYMLALVYGMEVVMQIRLGRLRALYRAGLVLLAPLLLIVARGLTGV